MTSTSTPSTTTTLATKEMALIRQYALQTGFLKKIFTSGGAFTAAQLTSEFRAVLKLAGVPLTTGELVTLDTLQIVLAGGAVVSSIAQGAQTAELITEGAAGAAGVVQLLSDLGFIDHYAADAIGLGLNAAMVIGSAGTNVIADIGLVISLITCTVDAVTTATGSKDLANSMAYNAMVAGIQAYIKTTIKPQYDYAAIQLRDFQDGKLNYFDSIANIALNAPYAFKSFFPGLSTYFPSWMTAVLTVTGTGVAGGWANNTTTVNTQTAKFVSLVTTKQQVESTLFNLALLKPLQAFENYFSVSNGISLHAISVLVMLLSVGVKGAVACGTDFNVLSACVKLGVTPSVLGDDWVFKGLLKNENVLSDWKSTLPYYPLTEAYVPEVKTGGVVINGKVGITTAQQSQINARAALVKRQLAMQALDDNGDMESLIQIPEARALLIRWATLKTPTVISQTAAEKMIHDSIAAVGSPTAKTLDFSDYWKALSVAKEMSKSNLFADEQSILLDFGSIDAILDAVDKAHTFVFIKALNRLARFNIAQATGIPANRLQSRTDSQGNVSYYDGGIVK